MAESTPLRQSAIVTRAPEGASQPRPVKTGELPHVQMKMAPGGPQVLMPQPKPVSILPPRDENSALRTGGLPMVNIKMTSRGPRPDDGQQESAVVVLPAKDQPPTAAGGLPMVNIKMTSTGPQVQNLPPAQKAPPQVQTQQPALSQPRRAFGAAPVVNKGRVVHVAAPQPTVALPEVPEFSVPQLMLCRHLADKYLAELRVRQSSEQMVVEESTQGEGTETTVKEAAAELVQLVQFVESTLEMIDQSLVAVAVRTEAAEAAAAAKAAVPVAPVPTSIIPSAPSASYAAGPTGGYVAGRSKAAQPRSAHVPRGVQRTSELPMVQVKMDGGQPRVQNMHEISAALAARREGQQD